MEPVGGTFIVLATFCPVESKVLPPRVADHLHRESLAMKRTLQYIFLYFFVPIIARNETRWAQCTYQKIVDAVYALFDADSSESEDEVEE